MNKVIKETLVHRSGDIENRLENDPIFRRTTEKMLAEILDGEIGDTTMLSDHGKIKLHTLRFSSQLLKPHIDNLQIGIVDAFEVGNLRNFLIWHNGLRRMFEIGIESVTNDSTSQRIKDFGQRKQRALETV